MALLPSTLTISLASGESITQGDVPSSPNYVDASISSTTPLTNGTGAGQAQHTVSVLVAATTAGVTIDLSALPGGLDGGTANFSSIKQYKIENVDASTNSVSITNVTSSTNTWTGISGTTTVAKTLQSPGGCIAENEPNAGLVVTTTNKTITFVASAGTVSTRVSLVGLGTA